MSSTTSSESDFDGSDIQERVVNWVLNEYGEELVAMDKTPIQYICTIAKPELLDKLEDNGDNPFLVCSLYYKKIIKSNPELLQKFNQFEMAKVDKLIDESLSGLSLANPTVQAKEENTSDDDEEEDKNGSTSGDYVTVTRTVIKNNKPLAFNSELRETIMQHRKNNPSAAVTTTSTNEDELAAKFQAISSGLAKKIESHRVANPDVYGPDGLIQNLQNKQ